jgi:hypothetical protein
MSRFCQGKITTYEQQAGPAQQSRVFFIMALWTVSIEHPFGLEGIAKGIGI